MKRSEYVKYQKAFAAFMASEGLRNLTTLESSIEPFPSRYKCEACGGLPGMRYEASGYLETEKRVSEVYAICQDCIYYAEYGRLDDMTMLDMIEDTPNGLSEARARRDDLYRSLAARFDIRNGNVFVAMTKTNERGICDSVEYADYVAAVREARFYE